MEHTGLVLTALDFTYFIILFITSANPYLSLFFAILFPLINLPFLKLSNKTGTPYIKYSLTFTLLPMCLVTYYSGVNAPGWILCFSAVAATQLMVDSQRYRMSLMAALILSATATSHFIGKPLLEVTTIFITLLAFSVILNRVISFMLLQNKALSRARREAEQANLAKDRFLSNMNHELRTPMNGVMGTVQLLESTGITEEQQHYIEILKTSGDHLLHIINDILDISKLDTDRFEFEKTPFELKTLVDGVEKLFHCPLEKQGNQLEIHIDPKVPEVIAADPVRLKQLLINLIGNANKFTTGGKIWLEITTQNDDPEASTLLFIIQDNGIGIAQQKQQSIFEAFSQADVSTTREYGGTGLGLAICKQLVETMGGRIWLQSELGNGSTFYFTLKVTVAAKPPKPTAEVVHLDKRKLAKRHPLSILVAEDNLINQAVIKQLLTNFGYQADVVEDGEKVLSALQDKSYDLILMDIQMPHMDGLQASQAIKDNSKPQDKPLIIAMTANTSPEDVKACMEAGMVAHIGKPVEVDKLEAAIIQWATWSG